MFSDTVTFVRLGVASPQMHTGNLFAHQLYLCTVQKLELCRKQFVVLPASCPKSQGDHMCLNQILVGMEMSKDVCTRGHVPKMHICGHTWVRFWVCGQWRKALQGEATCLGPTSGRGRTAPAGLLFYSFFLGKREPCACFGVLGVRYQFTVAPCLCFFLVSFQPES